MAFAQCGLRSVQCSLGSRHLALCARLIPCVNVTHSYSPSPSPPGPRTAVDAPRIDHPPIPGEWQLLFNPAAPTAPTPPSHLTHHPPPPPPPQSPYANGCFLFDLYIPDNFPSRPPQARFLTTQGGRWRANPNLYNCGKVCLRRVSLHGHLCMASLRACLRLGQ